MWVIAMSEQSGLVTRRRLLAACGSLTALSGCVGGESIQSVSVPDTTTYFKMVELSDDGDFLLGGGIEATLFNPLPEQPEAILVWEDGQQHVVEKIKTGETSTELAIAFDKDTTLEIGAVRGGEEDGIDTYTGGEVLERVEIQEEWA